MRLTYTNRVNQILAFAMAVAAFVCLSAPGAMATLIPNPAAGIEYFNLFGPQGDPKLGANGTNFTLYVRVPRTETQPLVIRVYDPDSENYVDEVVSGGSRFQFSIYGGHGASRGYGNLLLAEEFKSRYDRNWYEFAPVNPSAGDPVGNWHIFRVQVDPLYGRDGNLFRFEILPDNAQIYTYYAPIRLATKQGQLMQLFPEVPKGTRSINLLSYDVDPNGGTLEVITEDGTFPITRSESGQWSESEIKDIRSGNARLITYQITKGTQYQGNATLSVIDQDNKNLPIFFYDTPYEREVPVPEFLGPIENVYFEFDSAELREESRPQLDYVGKFLQENPGVDVSLTGYASSEGTFQHNMALSKRRAQAIATALMNRHGIDPARIKWKGMGIANPIADNSTEEGRRRNRRVEFNIHDPARGRY